MLCDMAPLPALPDTGISYLGQVYADARRWLETRKMREYNLIREEVASTHTRISLLLALEDSGIRQDDRLAGLEIEADEETYFDTVLQMLGELFPVESDLMFQNYLEDGDFSIIPSSQGMNSVGPYDDLCESFSSPDSYFSEKDALRVFFKMLDTGWVGEDWKTCNEFFGWNVPVPPEFAGETRLNSEKLERLLMQAGMAEFYTALEVSAGSGNMFFEYNPYDGGWDALEFTAENIRNLTNDWENAKATLECENRALEQCRNDPALYQKFAYLWAASLEADERVR